jgi:predicted membrane protein
MRQIRNRNTVIVGIALFLLFFMMQSQSIMVSGQSGEPQKTGKVFADEAMNVTASAYSRGVWTNEQWEYYTAEVKKDETINIVLDYTGNLDIDMRLYVDEYNVLDTNSYGWDITHCGIPSDPQPTRNSQIRGYNEVESVKYFNDLFTINRTVWILVFCYDSEGAGDSLYTLTSNITLTRLTMYNLQQCFGIREAWIVFGVVLAAITVVFLIVGKRAKMPKEQKALKKIKQEKQKTQKIEQKKEKAPVKKVSMKARGGTSRRR